MAEKNVKKRTVSSKKKSAVRTKSVKTTKAKKQTKAASSKQKRSVRSRFMSVPKVIGRFFVLIWQRSVTRMQNFLRRRPHRSFRLTKRRDYKRTLKLPGYFTFTLQVTAALWRQKLTFFLLGLVFFVLMIVFGLMGSQDIYGQLRDLMSGTAPRDLFDGVSGEIGKAGVILFTAVTSGLNGNLDSGQTIIASLLSLYMWLTVVWLLRSSMAGKKVKLRDGLYSAGAPLLPTALTAIVLLIQLLPGAIVAIVATSAWQSGFVEGGAPAMAAGIGLALVAVLSLYWITSTIIALVVVTLPGMYPFRAIAIAGDLVIGRRLRILYRFIWMIFVVVSWWVVIMVPVILFDGWIKSVFEQIEWVPIVPIAFLIMSALSIMWTAAYVYLLYRKVVDDDAPPA